MMALHQKMLVSVAAACLLPTAPVALAAEVGVSGTEVRIGEILPLTGPASLAGKAHFLGTKLAVAEANDQGGVNGRKVVVITEDDGYVPARTFQAAKKLVETDKVFGITGTSGTTHMAAMTPYLVSKNVPTIVSINPNQIAYDPPKPSIFVVGTDYGDAIYAQMKYFAEKLNLRDAPFSVIYQDDDFGLNVLAGYRRAIKDLKLKNVAETPYKRGQKDFGAEVLKVKEAGARVIVSGGIISENVAIMKEAEKLGMNAPIATVWTAHLPTVQKLAGKAGNGYYSADYVLTLTEDKAKPFNNLAAKYLSADEIKDVNRYTETAYVGARLLIEAMRTCGQDVTRACAISALESGKKFDVGTPMPPVSFAKNVRVSRAPVRVLRSDADNNRFVPVTEF
ncbi:ABC transporter substrate-binding protein [Cupriavidus metallidurans]|uniref:ABC transporter substrate-binding protein n=1 Tax=Cupriavidus metallidurans TaxID=119219 RepID=UPI0016449D25|nr:ABC transporter substrate-binding protein [Cupriavidus metallidurans]